MVFVLACLRWRHSPDHSFGIEILNAQLPFRLAALPPHPNYEEASLAAVDLEANGFAGANRGCGGQARARMADIKGFNREGESFALLVQAEDACADLLWYAWRASFPHRSLRFYSSSEEEADISNFVRWASSSARPRSSISR